MPVFCSTQPHRPLQERDAAVERWLREEVVSVYDAMQADPSRGLTPDQVASAMRARHAKRLKANCGT